MLALVRQYSTSTLRIFERYDCMSDIRVMRSCKRQGMLAENFFEGSIRPYDHGHLTGHGFVHWQTKALVLRHADKRVGLLIETLQVVVTDLAREAEINTNCCSRLSDFVDVALS